MNCTEQQKNCFSILMIVSADNIAVERVNTQPCQYAQEQAIIQKNPPKPGYLMSICKTCRITLAMIVCLMTSAVNAATVEDFSRHSQYHDAKISPDGKHLAVLVTGAGGGKSLIFLETEGLKITYTANANRKSQVSDYYWVNNERVIIQIEQVSGALEVPLDYGELYAVNYDGKKGEMLFGYRADKRRNRSTDWGHLLDILDSDERHVLITKSSMRGATGNSSKIVKLNVYTGRTNKVRTSPIGYNNYLIDNAGVPRFVSGVDNDFNNILYYTDGPDDDWHKFGEEYSGQFHALGFSQDNNSIFALYSKDGGPKGVYKIDLKSQKQTLLYQSKIADPSAPIYADLGKAYGVRIDEDYPSYFYLDNSTQLAKLHDALYRSFRGDRVSITSMTKDRKNITVRVDGDRNPGAYYLFNTETMKAHQLFRSAEWIKTKEMSPVEPFRIKSQDGLLLNGYVTLPKGKKKNLPTVVMPHGGPHARDFWRYDSQVQMLANAGYAVVQVNFRGSEGYGEDFKEAGYGHWGTKIQDDILLATKYIVQEGTADKNRICIFGASFGGYSALQSAIRKPNLFKCAIGYVGVYDLPMLYGEGDIKNLKWGDSYLDTTLGKDVAVQKAQSPVYHVDKLKAPVLLIHGKEDQRAPIEHAEKLRKALDKKNHPYEWLVKDKEGHGFYNEANILEANKAILAFLKKHLN